MTLQAANLDGLLVVAMVDAGPFAQDVHRTDTGTAGAEDVGVQDGKGRAAQIALRDFLDEARDVDMGGAGSGAGGVEAVEAAIGFDARGLGIERRMEVREAGTQFGSVLV